MAVKKCLLSFLLIVFLAFQPVVFCTPQDKAPVPWPLDVEGFQMRVGDGRAISNTSASTALGGNMRASGSIANGPVPGGQQKVSFLLRAKNPSSDKVIKQIEWESSFFNTQNQPIKNTFRSKKKLKPSKEELIEETIFFNVATIPTKVNLGFRIKKIEYEDNSVWENKNTTTDSDFVFQSVDVN